MISRNNLTLAVFFILTPLLLLSCNKNEAGNHQLRDGKGGKKYGGTFNMNETGGLRSLDPPQINDATSSHIAENIYDNLLRFDQDLNLIPNISSLPDISADGLTYTFHLRNDVFFQDDPAFPSGKGRRLTAQDVVYCWTRAVDPRTNTLALPYFQVIKGAKAYFASRGTLAGGVAGLQAPDDTTFVVTLERPFSPFINYAVVSAAYIYPKEAVEKYGKDYAYHPVGSGPFRLAEYREGLHARLVRNPNFWMKDASGNQLPYLDTLNFSFMGDNKAELLSFKQGNLDHVYRIPNEFFQDVVGEDKQLKGEYAKYQMIRLPALSTQFYGFNTSKASVKNRHLRRAISFAIDRNKIIKYVLKGQAADAGVHGIVPPNIPGYPADHVPGYTFNQDSARAELAIAKKEMGAIPELTLQLNTGGGRNQEVAEAIQSQLQQNLGLKINLHVVEWAQHTAMIDEGKAEFYRLGWIADYPDAQNFLNLLYGKNIPASGPSSINSTRYSNPAFDQVYEQAIKAIDRKEANTLWARCDSIAMLDAPIVVLYNDEDYHLLQPYVADFPRNPMDRRPMHEVWFKK